MKKFVLVLSVLSTALACGRPPAPPAPAATTVAPAPAPPMDTALTVAAPAPVAPPEPVAGGAEILLQDFEPNNGTEAFDIYTWDYGKAKPEVQSERAKSGTCSLRTQGDFFGVNFQKREFDLSNCQSLYVWVFDTVGDNTLEFTLADMSNKEAKAWSMEKSRKNQWTRVAVPIEPFRGKVDLAHVRNVRVFEANPGTYYFDDFGAVR